MNQIYFCVKDKNNTYIPFFEFNGNFFSKNNNETGGSSHISLDEIIQNIHYKTFIEDSKNNTENAMPLNIKMTENNNLVKETSSNLNETGGSQDTENIEFEISDKDVFQSALPEEYVSYLNNKLKINN